MCGAAFGAPKVHIIAARATAALSNSIITVVSLDDVSPATRRGVVMIQKHPFLGLQECRAICRISMVRAPPLYVHICVLSIHWQSVGILYAAGIATAANLVFFVVSVIM